MADLWVIGSRTNGIGDAVAREAEHTIGIDKVYETGTEVDVRNKATLTDKASEIKQKGDLLYHTRLNVVFCAGVNDLAWIEDIDQWQFLDMLAINTVGFVNVLSVLKQLKFDVVNMVAISSDAAITPMRGSMMYCVSKAGLNAAVKVAARELAPKWRINAISPSVIADTPMSLHIDKQVTSLRGWSESHARDYELSTVPMGRRAHKDEVAQLAIDVLMGPWFMSGSIVDIRGGK